MQRIHFYIKHYRNQSVIFYLLLLTILIINTFLRVISEQTYFILTTCTFVRVYTDSTVGLFTIYNFLEYITTEPL